MIRKLIIHDGHSERELVLVGTIVVGRDPSCHVTDLDPLLSRRHAEFVSTSKSVMLRDLGSRNGMLVNGEKVRDCALSDGDLVQLGHLQLRYVEDHTVDGPAAKARAHATTATGHDAAARAVVPEDSDVDLDDTRPHPPHPHATPEHQADGTILHHLDADEEVTVAPARRAPGPLPSDDEVTLAGPRVIDATVASAGRKAPPVVEPTFAMPRREVVDITVASRANAAAEAPGPQAEPVAEPTFAVPRRDAVDVTVASRSNAAAEAPGPHTGAVAEPTFAVPGRGFDVTVASKSRAAEVRELPVPTDLDLNVTVMSSRTPAPAVDTIVMGATQGARLMADDQLKVTSANAACAGIFGVAPDTLIGQMLSDLVVEKLQAMAAAVGPPAITLTLERSAADRMLTLTINAGQAIETAS